MVIAFPQPDNSAQSVIAKMDIAVFLMDKHFL